MANRSKNKKLQTIELCLAALHALPAARPVFLPATVGSAHAGILEISGPWGQCRYPVRVITPLTPTAAELIIHHARHSAAKPFLLLADYVPESLGVKLREAGLAFLDTVGNASLQQGALLVEVSGRKRRARSALTSRGFQPAGLRLVHLLLRKPEALNWKYRRLAEAAGLALGAVGPVLKELAERGFSVQDEEGARRLQNRGELFQRWEIGYLERLRPKLLIDRCSLAADVGLGGLPELIVRQNLQGQVQVGGELGAVLVLQAGRPRQATLHIKGDPLAAMLRLRLLPDPQGKITLLKALADHSAVNSDERLAPADPLLLHAELMAGGSEQQAQAQIIFERFIARHLLPRQTQGTP
jgi:hypothetical protein